MSINPAHKSISKQRNQTRQILGATLESLRQENAELIAENTILRNHLLAVKENASLRVANVISYLLQWMDRGGKAREAKEFSHNESDSKTPEAIALSDLSQHTARARHSASPYHHGTSHTRSASGQDTFKPQDIASTLTEQHLDFGLPQTHSTPQSPFEHQVEDHHRSSEYQGNTQAYHTTYDSRHSSPMPQARAPLGPTNTPMKKHSSQRSPNTSRVPIKANIESPFVPIESSTPMQTQQSPIYPSAERTGPHRNGSQKQTKTGSGHFKRRGQNVPLNDGSFLQDKYQQGITNISPDETSTEVPSQQSYGFAPVQPNHRYENSQDQYEREASSVPRPDIEIHSRQQSPYRHNEMSEYHDSSYLESQPLQDTQKSANIDENYETIPPNPRRQNSLQKLKESYRYRSKHSPPLDQSYDQAESRNMRTEQYTESETEQSTGRIDVHGYLLSREEHTTASSAATTPTKSSQPRNPPQSINQPGPPLQEVVINQRPLRYRDDLPQHTTPTGPPLQENVMKKRPLRYRDDPPHVRNPDSRSVSPKPHLNVPSPERGREKSSVIKTPVSFDVPLREMDMRTPIPDENTAHGHTWEKSPKSRSISRSQKERSRSSNASPNIRKEPTGQSYLSPNIRQEPSPTPTKKKSKSSRKKPHHSQKLKIKPCGRLIGEIAFELDRMILQYVFKHDSDSTQKKRLYGYMVTNIPAKILQESYDPNTRVVDEQKRYMLEYRYTYILNSLKPFGYDMQYHPDFCIDMVNKYGLLPLPEATETTEGVMPDEKELIKEAIQRIAAPEEVKDACILVDCLALLAKDSKQPLIAI